MINELKDFATLVAIIATAVVMIMTAVNLSQTTTAVRVQKHFVECVQITNDPEFCNKRFQLSN